MRRTAIWFLVATLACAGACDSPTPDHYAEQVRADIEGCREMLDELAACGPTADCFPLVEPGVTPFSYRVLRNCAASACAGLSGDQGHQCRFEAMLYPGTYCVEAKVLCAHGDDAETWVSPID
jgi:hypothetical protein